MRHMFDAGLQATLCGDREGERTTTPGLTTCSSCAATLKDLIVLSHETVTLADLFTATQGQD